MGVLLTGIRITRYYQQSQRNHNNSIIETFHFQFYIIVCNKKQLNSNLDLCSNRKDEVEKHSIIPEHGSYHTDEALGLLFQGTVKKFQ